MFDSVEACLLERDRIMADDYTTHLYRCARAALDSYGLAGAEVHLLNAANNGVFRVECSGAPYVLRIHRPGARAGWIDSELRWLRHLRAAGLIVPPPITTQAGELSAAVTLDGEVRHVALFGWLSGESRGTGTLQHDLNAVQQIGVFAARLHNTARAFTPPQGFSRPRLDAEGLFGVDSVYNPGAGAAVFTPEQRRVFAQVEAQTRAALGTLGTGQDAFGLIHGDLIAKNLLFHEGQVGALDFDTCAWGYYLYDLAPALLGFSAAPAYAALRAALLAGYRSLRALPPDHEPLLDLFIAARHTASCRWLAAHLDHPEIRTRAPQVIAHRVGELRHFLATGEIRSTGQTF